MASAEPETTNGLRAVVVGTGFGLRVHVPALRSCGVEVVALVGRDAERTERRAGRVGVARAFTSLVDALDECPADMVTIASPPDTHHPFVLEALRRGKHVICEKPLAVNGAEAAEMCEAAAKAECVAYVGYEFRYGPNQALMARLLEGGAIGRPRVATIVRLYSLLAHPDAPSPDWWFQPDQGGGWLNGNGSHAIDLMRVQLGEITSVSAAVDAVHPRPGGGDDSFCVIFSTADGARGVLQESAAVWGDPLEVWKITGTAGTLSLGAGGVTLADASGTRVVPLPPDLGLEDVDLDASDSRPWTKQEVAPYRRLVDDFCREVRGAAPRRGGPRPPTFEDGRRAVEILDSIRRSSAAGGLAVSAAGTGPVDP